MTSRSVTIVGPGRMGLALADAFLQSGAVGNVTVYGRRADPPTHPLFTQGRARYVFGVEPLGPGTSALFLAVPDAVVPEMAMTLSAQGAAPEGCAAFHLSASLTTDALGPLYARGYAVGAFHPMQVVVHPVSATDRIPGSYIAVTGSPEATATARCLAAALGCPVLSIPAGRRALFHAAAVLASSYLPPLLDLSARLLESAGVSSDDSLPSLFPLVRGVLASIEEHGLGGGGGPVAWGDAETVALHLRAMDSEERRLYATLGAELVRLTGPELDEPTRRELIDLLERNK